MLASDLNNREFSGAVNPDDLLNVQFYTRTLDNEYESIKQNRPVKYDALFIAIKIPGRTDLDIERFAHDQDKLRWPRQWQAFERSQSNDQLVGTRVEDWTALPRFRAEELKAIKFFTVEQVANASDAQKQRMGMDAEMLQQKAKAFLNSAQDTALVQSQAVELAKRDETIGQLQKTVNDLLAAVNGMKTQVVEKVDPPKKRGRPKKVTNDNDAGASSAG